MNDDPDIFSTPLLSGLAVTSPGLYFFMKHWSIILILFLCLLMSIGSVSAWFYTKHIQKKLDNVTKELSEYKNNYDILNQNYMFLRDEIIIVGKRVDSFNEDIDKIKKDNNEFRKRLNVVTDTNSNNISDTQKILTIY